MRLTNSSIILSNNDSEIFVIITQGPPFTIVCYHGSHLQLILNGNRLIMENVSKKKQIYDCQFVVKKLWKYYNKNNVTSVDTYIKPICVVEWWQSSLFIWSEFCGC